MRKLTDTILIIAVIAVVLFAVGKCTNIFDGVAGWFGPKTTISTVTLEEIQKIGQLKVLTVNKEFLVSQYRKRSFLISDDEIHIVYDGRIDLGFDLSKCDANSIERRNDSTFIHMPPVEILNQDSIYVNPGVVKIEDGKWSNAEMEAFKHRANAYMLYSSERDDCYRKAEKMGMQTFTDLVRPLETNYIEVTVEGRESYGMPIEKNAAKKKKAQTNPYKYIIDGSRHYLEYQNGATLTYEGVSDYDLIAVADMFNSYMNGKPEHVVLKMEKKKKSNSYLGFDSPFSKVTKSLPLSQLEKEIKLHVNKYLSIRQKI